MQEPPSTKRDASGPALRKTLLQYELLEKIGEGGMGEVYRARDTRLERSVAIKLLAADIAGDAERIRRFQQEARAASALNHPHIVAIHDTGQADSTHFIAMELVHGQPLGIWLERDKPDLRRVLEVITQVADALAAAHEAGIAHRDVKPGNLLVTRQGYAKVVDFGLAKLLETAAPGAEATRTAGSAPSRTGGAAGTIPYMSPEQAMGRAVDARTDIFSLGTVLYEAVTGRRPFTGGNQVDVLHAIVHAEPEAVRKWRPALPPELQWVVGKALAKDLDERYQTMAEFAADLRRLRRRMESGSASQLAAQVAAPRPSVVGPYGRGGAVGSGGCAPALGHPRGSRAPGASTCFRSRSNHVKPAHHRPGIRRGTKLLARRRDDCLCLRPHGELRDLPEAGFRRFGDQPDQQPGRRGVAGLLS